jgi:hypothetical protein
MDGLGAQAAPEQRYPARSLSARVAPKTALDSADHKLRGTALEYLDNVLPTGIKATLFALIPEPRSPKSERINQELIDELRRSGLFDLRARAALRVRDSS